MSELRERMIGDMRLRGLSEARAPSRLHQGAALRAVRPRLPRDARHGPRNPRAAPGRCRSRY